MKNSIKILLSIIFLLHNTIAFSADVLDGITLSEEQKTELKKITNLYKFKISRFFDLCKRGKNPKFKRVQPGEYEHLFEKAKKDLFDTVQNITTLYAKIGVAKDKIAEEEKLLHDGIQNCIL